MTKFSKNIFKAQISSFRSFNPKKDAEPFDDTVCPSGCSMEMFEKTIALRQKRCEIEDDMQDTKKMADTLRKDNDSLNKKVITLYG